jgi:Uma2 family endonuclease
MRLSRRIEFAALTVGRGRHTLSACRRLFTVKARLYARAGIAEFWLFPALDGAVEVYRAPGADGYAAVTQHGPGQTVAPLAFPDVSFAVSDFFA